ncbi:restriction endonuclease subunit S [Nitrosomonas sp.]|uniref:restriction endonuclease subunit S n=1 Tax=Nitrosomonas sp. TaxID=42353 RepID=UPI001DECA984|nr:restriction endonuclease subunit S [Nitrosomonas sp.]MBX9636908.1 restriction endonuclease subunit S [Nitrosomonas sp.]MBY0484670.1 restriction endonuclease subunit S [Nitrosomonas sp.]
MNNWKTSKLKDVCDRVTVGFVGSMAHEYQETGVPFFRSQNITPFRLNLDGLKYVSEQFHEKIRKSALHPGDVAVVRTGYPGTACVIPKGLEVSNCSDLVIIRPGKQLNPYFLCAIFNSTFGRDLVGGNLVGAAQQHFNITVAKELKFLLPSRAVQDKIAVILSTYDELIENNQRRIALLEKMAEEIYREWFVRMRFPGHEKVKKVKGLPEGWQRTKVVTLTSYLKRGVAPQYDDFAEGFAINQKCIRDGKLDLSFARHQSRDVSADRQIRFGDVLVNSTGEGTLGRVAQVLTQLSNCIVDSHVTIVRPKHNVPIHYFGMTLKAWEVHFSTMGRGATNQTELSPTVIGNIEVTMPSKPLQDVFESHAEPLFAQITYLTAQNEHLTRTRDLLLPRLISGKLSVEHLDIQFPPGMEVRP